MKDITLLSISFVSHVKLFTVIFLCIGIFCGLIAPLIALIGGDVTATLGKTEYTGLTAGLINIPLFPIVFTVIGVVFGLISYLPFKLFLKMRIIEFF